MFTNEAVRGQCQSVMAHGAVRGPDSQAVTQADLMRLTDAVLLEVEMRIDAADLTRTGGNQPHIVIPYNYADHEFVHRLTAALRHDRVTPWIDDVDMSAGAFLVSKIQQAARPVDCVVPAISAASVAANWVQHDIRTIMGRSYGGRHVGVLSARIDDCALPDFLTSQPYFDFHRYGWSAAYDELMIAVHKHMSANPGAPPPPGSRLPRPARLT
jgi:hypothetical protein